MALSKKFLLCRLARLLSAQSDGYSLRSWQGVQYSTLNFSAFGYKRKESKCETSDVTMMLVVNALSRLKSCLIYTIMHAQTFR